MAEGVSDDSTSHTQVAPAHDGSAPASGGPAPLYASRFSKATAASVKTFNDSLPIDRRLYREDILGSIAHARMLGKQGIIPADDARAIVDGLARLCATLDATDGPPPDAADEDIHSFVEARLHQTIGDAAGRLHTARSRNDQVATDLRLWTRRLLLDGLAALLDLQAALLDRAERDRGLILPGYTHLQRAQPVLLAHHWLAYVEMLGRDVARLEDCYRRADVLPLGSGALAGAPYPLDRAYAAKLLGFAALSANSLDAVSDRDFVVEHLAALALVAVHLSRLAEELVLWSSAEFGFVEMDDAYATGSSIMPQKKNSDVAELVRGKAGRAVGTLVQVLVTLKGLPLTYNKDLQEDKEGYFRAVDDSLACLQLTAEMVATLQVRPDRLRTAVSDPLLLATDLADSLTRAGLPFRQAHGVVGAIVRDYGAGFTRVPAEELETYSPMLAQGAPRLSPRASVQARNVPGGTAPRQVATALRRARRDHARAARRLEALRSRQPTVEELAGLPW
ncbi:MAG: argininosuccinate lyase [Chloroflexi bacterium]|nr:argininosuccinate lyase [Chloroflexota bacterium]